MKDNVSAQSTVRQTASGERKTVTSIARALDVLQLFVDSQHEDLGVTEIAKRLQLSKAVVHRILTTLTDKDLVLMNPSTRRYGLGPLALALGTAYLERLDVRALAQPVLRALSDATNETATLSIRHGWQRIYVEQALPDRGIKMTVPIGQPFPLHAGGSSKAFLAFLPAEQAEAYINERGLDSLTALTPTDSSVLRAELESIRQRGVAVSFGERQPGAGSVAAPVFDHRGEPIAAISICGPVERFRGEVDGFVDLLLNATDELSRRHGHHRAGSSPA